MNTLGETIKYLKEIFSNEMVRSVNDLERDILNIMRENEALKKQASILEGSIKAKDLEIKRLSEDNRRLATAISAATKR